jgi:hypothetical protein
MVYYLRAYHILLDHINLLENQQKSSSVGNVRIFNIETLCLSRSIFYSKFPIRYRDKGLRTCTPETLTKERHQTVMI